jgi:hypothetical protein
MTFRIATRVTVVLAATAALAQSAQPGTTPGAPILNRQSLAGRRGPVGNKTADPQGLAAMRERVKDMESTLSQMRVVLKQMNAKAAKSKATDSLTKANLGMLELRVQLAHHQFPTARDIGSTRRLRGSCRSLQAGGCQDKKPRPQAARAAQTARFAQAEKNATGAPTVSLLFSGRCGPD